MTPLRATLLALSLLLPAACSTWNPLVALGIRSEPAHKPTPLAALTPSVRARVAWSAPVGKGGGFRFLPAANEGRLYAAAADGNVTVVDEDSGRVAARIDTKKRLSGGVGFGDGKVFVGTLKGEVVALDPAGKIVWTTSVAGEVIAAPSVVKKVVVVRTADGRMFGLSTDDGKRLWVFQRPSPSLLLRSEAGS